MPKSVAKFIVFSSVDFVRFWCVPGCIIVTIFDVFRGLQRRIATNLDMLSLSTVSRNSLIFRKRRAINSLSSYKFRALEYAFLGASFRA